MLKTLIFGFIIGTLASLGFFTVLTKYNGTPVPSVHDPIALLTYPTGSVTMTVTLAAVIYFLALVTGALIFWKGNPRALRPARAR